MMKNFKYIIVSIILCSTTVALAKEEIVCPPDKPLSEFGRECFSCDTLKSIYNETTCSTVCPNRKIGQYGRTCILNECPDNAPLRDTFTGNCFSCDEIRDISVDSDWMCAQCNNRIFYERTSSCSLACPTETPIKEEKENRWRDDLPFHCYSCNDPKAIMIGFRHEDECSQCPNRELVQDRYCVLKGECPADFPIRDSLGGCHATNDPLPIKFDNPALKGREYLNDSSEFQRQQCALYPERQYEYANGCILKNCPFSHPIRYNSGCYSCDFDNNLPIDKEACDLCPNRFFYTTSGKYNYCILPCPADKPLPDGNGGCHACDEENAIKTDACSICPNREQIGENCNVVCGGDKPLQNADGSCFACKPDRIRVDSKERCAVCPKSTYVHLEKNDGHICVECPADKPLISAEDAECYACADDRAIKLIDSQDNSICGDMRKMVNGYSALKECPAGQLVDNHGECWSCENNDNLIDVSGSESNCDICPNRIVKNGYCIINDPTKPIIELNTTWKHFGRHACDEKGDYGIGLSKIYVTGTEDTCEACPNRRVLKEKHNDMIESYCVGK